MDAEQIYRLQSIIDNEPLDYAVDQGGHFFYEFEEGHIHDAKLKKLLVRYLHASRNLKKYLRDNGVSVR